MARYDFTDIDTATLAPVDANGEAFYELGIMYASGRSVPVDPWDAVATAEVLDAARQSAEAGQVIMIPPRTN